MLLTVSIVIETFVRKEVLIKVIALADRNSKDRGV